MDNNISIHRNTVSRNQELLSRVSPREGNIQEAPLKTAVPLDDVQIGGVPDRGDKEPADTVNSGTPQAEKEVTVLLYMDGQYADLEPTMASIPIGLENLGSSQDMNVVLQLGRASQAAAHPEGGFDRIDNDWSGVHRYYIHKAETPHKEMTELADWLNIAREKPENPIVHFVLGELYESQGMKEESEAEFRRSEDLGYMKLFREPFNPQVRIWNQEFQQAVQPLRDSNAAENVYSSPVTEDMGTGVDMKHPNNLKDFIAWGMKNYPAKHYVVVMGGHGGAWTGALAMSPSDIGMALQAGTNQANRATGRHDAIDVTVLNSCYMGNLESVNEMSNASDIIIASEMSAQSSVLNDWPEILGRVEQGIQEGRPFTAEQFSRDFVSLYEEKGKEIASLPLMRRFSKEHYLTCAAVDTLLIDNVTAAWKDFVTQWSASGVDDSEVYRIIAGSKNYPSFAFSPEMLFDFGTLRDLGSIADNMIKSDKIPESLRASAAGIKEALSKAVIAEQHTGHDMEDSSGLTVWAPTSASDIALMAAPYGKRVPDFVQSTNWDKKLVEGVAKADQKCLARYISGIKSLAQIQDTLKSGNLDTDAREKLMTKTKELQAQLSADRELLSLAGVNLNASASPAGDGAEKEGKPDDRSEGSLTQSLSGEGIAHGAGMLSSTMQEGEVEALSQLTDRALGENQAFHGMGFNPGEYIGL